MAGSRRRAVYHRLISPHKELFALEQDRLKEQEVPALQHTPPVLGALLLLLFVFISMPQVNRFFHMLLFDIEISPPVAYMLLIAQQALCVGLPAWFFFKLDPFSLASLRPRLQGLPRGAWLSLSLGALMTVFALNNLVTLWYLLLDALSLPAPLSGLPVPDSSGSLLYAFVAVALTPALCEELLMRGLVLSSLEIRGSRFAVLMSGLLFGLMHGQLVALPAHVLLGFLLGWLFVGYGSLWASILFHAAYNACSVLLSYAGGRVADSASAGISAADFLLPSLMRVLLFAPLAAALLYYPMRAAVRKNPPRVFVPGDRRLTLVEKLVLALLLLAFLAQYILRAGVGA